LQEAQRHERMALLFGSEGRGLQPEWVALCDRRITLPMHPGTDSLNVAVASGIFLYHFMRDSRSRSS
jgi:tRNA G18 (ribose-2'-O)-methylase SpoU